MSLGVSLKIWSRCKIAASLLVMAMGGRALGQPMDRQPPDRRPVENPSRSTSLPTTERDEKPQLAAATAKALATLRDDIEKAQLTPRLTVGTYIRQTASSADLRRLIEKEQQRPAPRWIDAETCQVQIEIGAEKVVGMLQQVAQNHPRESPLSSEEIARETKNWKNRTFIGTGSSTAFGQLITAPIKRANGNWATVSSEDRKKALIAARGEAMNKVIDGLKPVVLANGKTLGDALSDAKIYKALYDWLESRPVVQVEYRADMQVELTLQGSVDGCLAAMRRALLSQTVIAVPTDEKTWETVRASMTQRMPEMVGRGAVGGMPKFNTPNGDGNQSTTSIVPSTGNPGNKFTNSATAFSNSDPKSSMLPTTTTVITTTGPSVGQVEVPPRIQGSDIRIGSSTGNAIPPRVAPSPGSVKSGRPDWTGEFREAKAIGKSDSKLKAAREAETIARMKLQREINLLTLDDGQTIEQAQKGNVRIEPAIRDALEKAKSTVNYDDADGVAVTLRFELADLWDAIKGVR